MRSSRRNRTVPPRSGEGPAAGEREPAWTAERIHGLGVSTDLVTAAAVLGMSRSAAYKLIRRDAFPVPHFRVGARYRIPTAPLLAALHLHEPGTTPERAAGATSAPP
ncbi:helix-turn-helix domain-containing protein [Verrucosispora sp. WMMD573]|uniref:helix-turn-helix domain-containing protein n=1 Tax=Verrucosispora sp. WMMD573 TaxID=3015149 RepID=UPI00248D387A|nr:helix-turn-helix domain-containing protein [Verrucosispora sp. WMMD573]WBB56309.1 helix-turn-helix domain-containing protein [Verrucosispora sp. WMMD573]